MVLPIHKLNHKRSTLRNLAKMKTSDISCSYKGLQQSFKVLTDDKLLSGKLFGKTSSIPKLYGAVCVAFDLPEGFAKDD